MPTWICKACKGVSHGWGPRYGDNRGCPYCGGTLEESAAEASRGERGYHEYGDIEGCTHA